MSRYLIVNADDFGFSAAVDTGVVAAHDRGIVTSASLMVRGASVVRAVALAAVRPSLSLGLHVDLGEWVPEGEHGWVARDVVVDTSDAAAVACEVDRQLRRFHDLVGADPTHLDGHQHVQLHEPAHTVLRHAARHLGVPLRGVHDGLRFCGHFYGQGPRGEAFPDGVTLRRLIEIIRAVGDGWTELGCHPGIAVDASTTTYACEREVEVAALCAPSARAAILAEGIVLASFHDL